MNESRKKGFENSLVFLGSIDFSELKDNNRYTNNITDKIDDLEVLSKQIKEMLEVALKFNLPDTISLEISNFFTSVNNLLRRILSYDLDIDKNNRYVDDSSISDELGMILKRFFDFQNESKDVHNISIKFHSIYAAVKSYKIKDFNEFEILKLHLNAEIRKVEEMNEVVINTAAKLITQNHARIFEEQSKEHSGISISRKWPFIKIGGANAWLYVGLVILTFGIIIYLGDYVPNSKIDSNLLAISPLFALLVLINKFVFLGIWFFLIRFAFRQYSINKHLYTANKHRQNVLNSFQLLYDLVKDKDLQTKNELIIEISRSIYGSSDASYLSPINPVIDFGVLKEFLHISKRDK